MTIDDITDKIVELTGLLLNMDINTGLIRQAYATDGQPFQAIAEDVIYVYAMAVDDAINKQIDSEYLDSTGTLVSQNLSYTRVISVQWVFYGDSYLENAEKLRLRLFNSVAQEFCELNNLKLIPNVYEIKRNNELFQGRWWKRCDFMAQFNNNYSDQIDVETIGTVEIDLNNRNIEIIEN